MPGTKRALFIDWGGTLALTQDNNQTDVDAAGNPILMPNVATVLARERPRFDVCFIVSNQPRVATGEISMAEVDRRVAWANERLGRPFTDWRLCPHTDEDGCDCRKPLPGMLLKAAADHDLDLANSWMIGDSNGDVQAGKAAGCHTIRIATGILGSNETMADYQAADLLHAIQRILKNHEKADLLPVSPPLIGLPAFEYDISWLLLD